MPAKKPAPPTPPPVEINSPEAADLALGELAEMATKEAAARAVCDAASKIAIDAFNEACKTKVGEEEMNFADRRKQLETALEVFATARKEELFTKVRTLKLNHGEIGFREGNKCVMPVEKTEKEVKEGLVERIIAGINKVLNKLTCGGCPVLSATFAINKTGLLDAFRNAKFKPSSLKKFGLKIAATERFFCEPKEQEVTSQASGG